MSRTKTVEIRARPSRLWNLKVAKGPKRRWNYKTQL